MAFSTCTINWSYFEIMLGIGIQNREKRKEID
jgi:hypothetical protein